MPGGSGSHLANNQLNWQWVASTDSRPNRVLNPVSQAKRYAPDGTYVHHRVLELRGVDAPAVHEPWNLAGLDRVALEQHCSGELITVTGHGA
jgi:deoxyribodipyrimidine photo-lyase